MQLHFENLENAPIRPLPLKWTWDSEPYYIKEAYGFKVLVE